MQELTPKARTEEEKGPAELCTIACQNVNQPMSASFHNFQDQLDEIDGELTWYDDYMGEDTEGELVVQQCGVGSQVVGPANFLKNLFSQFVPGSTAPKMP